MKTKIPAFAILALATAFDLSAGTLSGEGVWTPSGCGDHPPDPPALDQASLDAFNASLEAVIEWRRNAKTYYECLVKEANSDNAIIARTANEEQAKYRETSDQINTDAAAIKKNLEGE